LEQGFAADTPVSDKHVYQGSALISRAGCIGKREKHTGRCRSPRAACWNGIHIVVTHWIYKGNVGAVNLFVSADHSATTVTAKNRSKTPRGDFRSGNAQSAVAQRWHLQAV
jgi:hypothetical protein